MIFDVISPKTSNNSNARSLLAKLTTAAQLAAIIGPVALFASLMPRWIFYGSNRYEAENSKMLASLLPCTAFAFGADILSDYEYAEIGVQSFNMDEGAYSFRICLIMMAFDAVFYFFLSWYTDQIVPGQVRHCEERTTTTRATRL